MIEETVRDIEMSYEMLFAFLAMHGEDAEIAQAGWRAAHQQVLKTLKLAMSDPARIQASEESTPLGSATESLSSSDSSAPTAGD